MSQNLRRWIIASGVMLALAGWWNLATVQQAVSAGIQTIRGLVTADTELPAAVTITTGLSAPTAPAVAAYMMCKNSAGTYDPCVASGDVAHDAAAASINPLLIGGYASAAAPTDVSADIDAVRAWYLRNGAAAINQTFAGVLASTGTGASGTGTQRVVLSSDSALAANQSVNISQINGVTPLMGNGATGTGSPRTTEATDSQLSAGVGATSDAAVAAGASGSLTAKLRQLTNLTIDPCSSTAKIFAPINQTTGTQLFSGTASNRTYVCSIHAISATAQNVALVSGTGTVCATGTQAMAGGTTAATGWNLIANEGLVVGNGQGSVMKSAVDANNVCLLQSSTGQISGTIAYAVAPN